MFRQLSMQARVAVPGASGQLDTSTVDNKLHVCDGNEYSLSGPFFTSSRPRYVNPHHQPTEVLRSHFPTLQVQQPQPQNVTCFSSSRPYDCSSGPQRRVAELSVASPEPVSGAVNAISTGPVTQTMFNSLQIQQGPNAFTDIADTRDDCAVAATRPTFTSPYAHSDETPNSLLHCSQPVQPLSRLAIDQYNTQSYSSLPPQQVRRLPSFARHSTINVSSIEAAQAMPSSLQPRIHIATRDPSSASAANNLAASQAQHMMSTMYGAYDKSVAYNSLSASASTVLQQPPQSPPPGSWCAVYEPHNAYGAYVSGYESGGPPAASALTRQDYRAASAAAAASTIPATAAPINTGNFLSRDFPKNYGIMSENLMGAFPTILNEACSNPGSMGYRTCNSDTGLSTDGPSPHHAAPDSGPITALTASSHAAVQPQLTALPNASLQPTQPTPTATLTRPPRVSFADGTAQDAASPDSVQALHFTLPTCASADDSTAPYRPGGSTAMPLHITVPTARSTPATPAAAAAVTTPSSEMEIMSYQQQQDVACRGVSNATSTSAALTTPALLFPFGAGPAAPSQDSASAQEGPAEAAGVLPSPVTVQVASRCRRTDENGVSVRGRVTRGAVGVFHPKLYLAGGDCIQCDGEIMSRGRFERLAGTATAKWHVSIKVLPTGMTLGKWLQMHGLPILQGRPRKRRAVTDDDRDPEAEEDFSGPLQPLSQPQASQPHPAEPQSPSHYLTQSYPPHVQFQIDTSAKRLSEPDCCQQQPAGGLLYATQLPQPKPLPGDGTSMPTSFQEKPSLDNLKNGLTSNGHDQDKASFTKNALAPAMLGAESSRNRFCHTGSNPNDVITLTTTLNPISAEADMESVFALLDSSTLDDLLLSSGDHINQMALLRQSSYQHHAGPMQTQDQHLVPTTTNAPSQPPPFSQPQYQEIQYPYATLHTPNPAGSFTLPDNSNPQPFGSCVRQPDAMQIMTQSVSVNVPIPAAAAASQPNTGPLVPPSTSSSSATMTTTTRATTITTGLAISAQQPSVDPMRPMSVTSAVVSGACGTIPLNGDIGPCRMVIGSSGGSVGGNGGYCNNGSDSGIDGAAIVYGRERSASSSSSLCPLPQLPGSGPLLPSAISNVNMPILPTLSSHGSCVGGYESYDTQDPEAVRQNTPYASGDCNGSGGSGSMGPWVHGNGSQREAASCPGGSNAVVVSSSGGVSSNIYWYRGAGGGDGFSLLQPSDMEQCLPQSTAAFSEHWQLPNEDIRQSNAYSSNGSLLLPLQPPPLPMQRHPQPQQQWQPPSTLCWTKTEANGTTETQGWVMPGTGPQLGEWRMQALQQQKQPQWQARDHLQEQQQLMAPSMPMGPTGRYVLGATAWQSVGAPFPDSTRSAAERPQQMPQMQPERAVQQVAFAMPIAIPWPQNPVATWHGATGNVASSQQLQEQQR